MNPRRRPALLRLGRAMWFRWGGKLRRELLMAQGRVFHGDTR